MKNYKKIIIATLAVTGSIIGLAYGAGVNQRFPTDSLQMGVPSSTTDKAITFNTGDGGNNPKLAVDGVVKKFKMNKNLDVTGSTLTLGTGTAVDQVIKFDKDGSSDPVIKYNSANSRLQFSNDGTLYKDIGSGSGSGSGGFSVLSNPGFEDGASVNWANSGGTYTEITAGANLLFGEKSVTFDASAASQYVQSDLYDVPAGLQGGNCGASIYYKGGDANLALKVLDGSSTVLATQTLSAATYSTKVSVTFPCPTSGQFRLRIESTANAAVVALDNASLGDAGLFQVAEAKLLGGIRYAGITNCNWGVANTGGFVDFGTDDDCTGRVLSGNASGPADSVGNRKPEVTFANLPAGNYQVVVTLNALMSLASGSLGFQGVRLSDGTSVFSPPSAVNLSTSDTVRLTAQNLIWNITYDTAQTNKTFKLQGNASASGAVDIQATNANQDFEIKVYRFPLQAELAIRPDNSNYGWTAYTPTFTGFGTVSGTTCYHSRDNENLKVRCKFTPGTTTATEARVSFPGSYVASSAIPTLELAGTAVINVTTNGYASVLREPSVSYFTFGRDGGGSTGLTKFNGSTWVTSGNAVSFEASAPIQGWTVNQAAPQLINSVISAYDGVWRTNAATIGKTTDGTSCTSTPCDVFRSSGNWISSVARTGTGGYTVSLSAGAFSASPHCFVQPRFGQVCGRLDAVTTSTVEVSTYICNTGAATDAFFSLRCEGAR